MFYRNIEKSLKGTIEKNFPIHYRNPKKVPVQISVRGNNIEITAFVAFKPNLLKPYTNNGNMSDSFLKTKEPGFSFADAVCEGITKNWSGKFELDLDDNSVSVHKSVHDNDIPDIGSFTLKTKVIRKDDPEAEKYPGQRFFTVKEPLIKKGSFVLSPLWRWFWGLVRSPKSPESISLNWSPYWPGSIHLIHYGTLSRYEQVAAHEFGHIMGIGDAYGAPYRFFWEVPGTSDYMMNSDVRLHAREIIMALTAHKTGVMQHFPSKIHFKTMSKQMKSDFNYYYRSLKRKFKGSKKKRSSKRKS